MAERAVPSRESPLHSGLPAGQRAVARLQGVRLEERPLRTHHLLRTREPGPLGTALEQACGARLPLEPNATVPFGGGRAIWLSPTEWLLVLEDGHPLAAGGWAAGRPGHLIDVSGGQSVIALAGEGASDILSAGCMLDLHPRTFLVHQAARTLVAKAPVILIRADILPTFEVIVARSYALYLWRWLQAAGRGPERTPAASTD